MPVGTSIRLSCLSGFAIDSNSRSQTSTCTNDGVWEPPLRSCQTMQCAPPPRMSGMQITGDLYRLNNVVTYKYVKIIRSDRYHTVILIFTALQIPKLYLTVCSEKTKIR